MTTTFSRILHHWPQTPTTGPSPREIPDVTRDDLAELFGKLGFTYGVEVGTEQGVYAERICKAIKPDFLANRGLWCVDPYLAYGGYREHTSQLKLDRFYAEARERLAPYDVHFIREPSVEAARHFEDGSLDFVYIDANHSLLYVIQDLVTWVPKVRKGGAISGHDYIRRNNRLRYQCHVVEAVHAYTQSYMIDPWYVVGAKDEVAGVKRDAIRSFFWVKQ
jgi:hypothetical protein